MADGVEDRVSREEFYPKVGEATESLKALMPTFGERLIEVLIEGLNHGVSSAELELVGNGANPQTFRVKIAREGVGSHLRVRLEGDWESTEVIPSGLPLIADYDGAFFRKMRPEDEEPITKEGTILEPDSPIGLASAGKGKYWLWRLPPADFPNGGKLTQFIHPSGEDVAKGQSIICYVEKL